MKLIFLKIKMCFWAIIWDFMFLILDLTRKNWIEKIESKVWKNYIELNWKIYKIEHPYTPKKVIKKVESYVFKD